MKREDELHQRVRMICQRDPRFAPEAYMFVQSAVGYTQDRLADDESRESHHITGPELLEGIRELAIEEFGPMAITVFADWGIATTRDFGEIVFSMVNEHLLGARDSDSVTDFEDGYDFESVFVTPFLPAGKPAEPPVIDA